MSADGRRTLKVGALVLVALVVFAAGVFLIGEKNNLFSLKNKYSTKFKSVSGLNPGNPVQLNGVKVGSVRAVVLPQDPSESEIRIELSVDRRYAERIRGDSKAQIKTIGLLGDKYVELSSGSLAAPVIENGAEIPADQSSAVDALVESGEDVMANVTEISASLRTILGRMERGEGLLGELVSNPETGQRVTDALMKTLESIQHVANRVETGEGAIPRLITDRQLAERLDTSVMRLESFLAKAESGEGLAPALLTDTTTRERFDNTLASLETAAADLAAFTKEMRDSKGLLHKLLLDEQYGEKVSGELEQTLSRINRLTAELESGDGTAAKLIHDPAIYEAVQDIVIGVNESKLLRWLIRNRQKAGIEKRYEEAREGEAPPP